MTCLKDIRKIDETELEMFIKSTIRKHNLLITKITNKKNPETLCFTLIRKYSQQLITNADRQGHNKQAIRLGGLLLYIHKNRLYRM